jgi:hypothetical protein
MMKQVVCSLSRPPFLPLRRRGGICTLVVCLVCWVALLADAAPIFVPNASFESPQTSFVELRINSWQNTAKPSWYDESGGFLWTQLTGIFKNTPVGSADHLENCHSNQAIWMFAVPEVGLFQDYTSLDWSNTVPTHAFDALFEVGKSYTFTMGVNGGGGGMSNGATMQISIYYRDAASNRITVAATTITNTPETFHTHTYLADVQAHLPTVRPADPWAGQHIGLLLLSTVSTNLQGGYWDLDNIRLTSIQEPTFISVTRTSGQFEITLKSEPSLAFEILAATDLTVPLTSWTSLGFVTNQSGLTNFRDPSPNLNHRFYRARQLP